MTPSRPVLRWHGGKAQKNGMVHDDTRPEWVRKIKVGDVLRAKSGLLRVVRGVHHYKSKTYVTFSIKRCSWTGRCYTVYTHCDLKQMFEPTGKSLPLRRNIDRRVRLEIENSFRPDKITVHCCDVGGIS